MTQSDQSWQSKSERSSRFWIVLMKGIALSLGRSPARLLLYPISAYFFLFSPSARRASKDFLTHALDRPPSLRESFRHFFYFSSATLDRVYLLTGQEQRLDIRFHRPELVLNRADNSKGVILLGSHLGSFEVLRALGARQKHFPLKVLLNAQQSPAIMRVLDALNPEVSQTVISLDSENAVLKIKETLDQGGVVGMLGDRVTNKNRTVFCKFFAQETTFPSGPLLLAVTLNVPVILFFGLYAGGNRYEIFFEPLFDGEYISRKDRPDAIKKLTQEYVSILEKYARKSPYNWFNFYDFWKRH